MGMKSFYPKGNWVKRKSKIKESVENLIKWAFEKTVNKSWQNRWETNPFVIRLPLSVQNNGFTEISELFTSNADYHRLS